MNEESRLVAWIGKTDHKAAEGGLGTDLGPIAAALVGNTRYSRIYPLSSYDFGRSRRYGSWLEKIAGYTPRQVDRSQIDRVSGVPELPGIWQLAEALWRRISQLGRLARFSQTVALRP